MSNINIPSGATNLRNNLVDMLTTKNIDMKGRRVIGAGSAKDTNDYVTLDQLNQVEQSAAKDLVDAFAGLIASFRNTAVIIKHLVTSIISPISDAGGIVITKADRTTPVITINTQNAEVEFNGPIYSTNAHPGTPLPTVPFVGLEYVPSHTLNLYGDLVSYDPSANAYLPMSIRCSQLTLAYSAGRIAFFSDDTTQAQAQQILLPYTTNIVGTFVGIPNTASGNVYATVNDLNTLATAYNNLRAMCDDLRTKLLNSTLVR